MPIPQLRCDLRTFADLHSDFVFDAVTTRFSFLFTRSHLTHALCSRSHHLTVTPLLPYIPSLPHPCYHVAARVYPAPFCSCAAIRDYYAPGYIVVTFHVPPFTLPALFHFTCRYVPGCLRTPAGALLPFSVRLLRCRCLLDFRFPVPVLGFPLPVCYILTHLYVVAFGLPDSPSSICYLHDTVVYRMTIW